jgi:hypothetical protein
MVLVLVAVDRMERDMENLSSPNIFEENLGPCECPPYIQVEM